MYLYTYCVASYGSTCDTFSHDTNIFFNSMIDIKWTHRKYAHMISVINPEEASFFLLA